MRATTNEVSMKASAKRLFSRQVEVDVLGEVFGGVDGNFAKLGHQAAVALHSGRPSKFLDDGIKRIQALVRNSLNFSFDQFLGNHERTSISEDKTFNRRSQAIFQALIRSSTSSPIDPNASTYIIG